MNLLALWIHFQCLFVLRNCLADFVEFLERVGLADSDSELHLGDSLLVFGAVLAVISVLVVFDESDSIVAFGDDTAETLEAEETCRLVHIDSDVVQAGRLSRDLQTLLLGL